MTKHKNYYVNLIVARDLRLEKKPLTTNRFATMTGTRSTYVVPHSKSSIIAPASWDFPNVQSLH